MVEQRAAGTTAHLEATSPRDAVLTKNTSTSQKSAAAERPPATQEVRVRALTLSAEHRRRRRVRHVAARLSMRPPVGSHANPSAENAGKSIRTRRLPAKFLWRKLCMHGFDPGFEHRGVVSNTFSKCTERLEHLRCTLPQPLSLCSGYRAQCGTTKRL